MLNQDRWHEIDTLLGRALDLPPEERRSYVRQHCTDTEILSRVERLLDKADRSPDDRLSPGSAFEGTFADAFLLDLDRRSRIDGDPQPGKQVDSFELTRRLGEGGMGEVWEAKQLKPVPRQVALKVIKRGMDSFEVVSRFESERKALARMNHRNVAQVFGGGTTESGRPYFVMEFINGSSVTDFCKTRELSIEKRLELFMQICDGVQHAHHKGIVHRDLKPTNILISENDGDAIPKVIDFGVARALGDKPTDVTAVTEKGQVIGTVEYMSPEQADPISSGDIDTRADVYALGVLLYELLTDVRPFNAAELRDLGYFELLHRIRETDPERPSERVDVTTSRRLRGDLDWIVMKAMEKERSRRYNSPKELAEDVLRHLSDEPVVAGPPSRTYRLKKLVRRHRTTAIASVVALVALVSGAGIATTQAVRATRAEKTAQSEAATAEQVSEFLVNLFEVSAPERAQGETVTARELLDRGAQRIEEDLGNQPLVQARMQYVIGGIYNDMALFEPAEALLQKALKNREAVLGPDDPDVLQTLHEIGRLYNESGNFDAAESTLRDALARLASSEKPDPVRQALLRAELGSLIRPKGRLDEAETLYRQAMDALSEAHGPTHESVGKIWGGLGAVLQTADRLDEAVQAYRTSLEILTAVLGHDHLDLGATRNNLANTLSRLGKLEEAEAMMRTSLEVHEKAYGPDHPTVASNLAGLAAMLGRQGRLQESEEMFSRALSLREEIFGRDHPKTAQVLKNIGLVQLLMGKLSLATQTLTRTLAIEEKNLGPDHPDVAWTRTRLGGLYLRRANYGDAEKEFRRAIALTEARMGVDHLSSTSSWIGLGRVESKQGRFDAAEVALKRALSIVEASSTENPFFPQVLRALGEVSLARGALDEAESYLERCHEIQAASLRPGHPSFAETLVSLGELRSEQGSRDEARALFREALEISEAALGAGHPDVARALHGLGIVLAKDGNHTEAKAKLDQALAVRREVFGDEHPDTKLTERRLASLERP